MTTDHIFKFNTHLPFFFRPIKHKIRWRPPHLHVKNELNWLLVCLYLNSLPHFFSLWGWTFLKSIEHIFMISRWTVLWLQLTLLILPRRAMWVHVHSVALDQNAVTCCKLRWAFVSLGWSHVQGSCHSWVNEINTQVEEPTNFIFLFLQ